MVEQRAVSRRSGLRMLALVGLLGVLGGASAAAAGTSHEQAGPIETAGDLQERIGAAWAGVRTIRASTVTTTTGGHRRHDRRSAGRVDPGGDRARSAAPVAPWRGSDWWGDHRGRGADLRPGRPDGQGLGEHPVLDRDRPGADRRRHGGGVSAGATRRTGHAAAEPAFARRAAPAGRGAWGADDRRSKLRRLSGRDAVRLRGPGGAQRRSRRATICRAASPLASKPAGIRATTVTTFLAYNEPLTIEPPVAGA